MHSNTVTVSCSFDFVRGLCLSDERVNEMSEHGLSMACGLPLCLHILK